jgi:hypothetical protein
MKTNKVIYSIFLLKLRLIFWLIFSVVIIMLFGIAIHAFLTDEITKVDVSDSVVVPENYDNLLVLNVIIRPTVNLKSDTLLHNGQAGSSAGDILSSFASTDWYSDQNGNLRFDGNQIATDNEATISSSDDILSPDDFVKNTGLAFIKSFKYSTGVYEQYVDSNHSNSYTAGEAIIRKSTTSGEILQGDVIRGGSADMTAFPSYIKFTDGIQGTQNPAKYQNGEAIIVDAIPYGIISDADTVLSPGNADLKAFPNDTLYSDVNNDNKYTNGEAVIIDKGVSGKLDTSDIITNAGNANLKQFGSNEKYADSNGNGLFDSGELLLVDISNDMKVQSEDIKIPGFANLRSMPSEDMSFSDSNKNANFDTDELIILNTKDPNILESSDVIFKSGKADLKLFNGIEKFIDSNKNGIYDDGESIIHDAETIGRIEPNDIEKPGTALLRPFGNNYLFTDANNDAKYTGDLNLSDGYHGEAIFKDTNNNGLIENGELITSGYAPIKSFPAPLWFVDTNGNSIYDIGESAIISNDNRLSTDDNIVIAGSAYLTIFPQGIIKWAEVNNNDKYDDDELIVSSPDDILSTGEVIKSGLCGLKPSPTKYSGYIYADNNNNDNYSSDELIIASTDKKLDSGDSVINAGKANLLRFQESSLTYYQFIDADKNNYFDQNEVIVNNNDPVADTAFLDSSDEVVKTGVANIKSFNDETVYVDVNVDGRFQGDADGDVAWNKLGNLIDPNDPDIIADQDEVVLKDPIGANHLVLDDGDTILRPGMARLRNFSNSDKYIDHYNLGEFSGSTSNEAIIRDSNGILENTDIVLVTGQAIISNFSGEKYIDDNGDSAYTNGEAIWRDSGSIPNKLDLTDEIVKPGYASLISLDGYKYTNDGINPSFTGAQAIITDNAPTDILSRNDIQIKYGTADVKAFSTSDNFIDCDGNGKYTDGEPIFHYTGQSKIVVNPGILSAFPVNIKYIDSDDSGFYNAAGSPLVKTSTEAVISDNGDKELNAGPLDGTGADRVLVSGYAKIKPIGNIASKLNPANPQINAFLDKNVSGQTDDYKVLITDNPPVGILDPSDIVWGKILVAGDFYDWSGSSIVSINGSTLSPPNSSINAYIDSYNIGFLDNYEVLIIDKNPVGILGSNDVIVGEIKDKNTLSWSANLEDGLPWRQLIKGFNSQEKFLTSKSVVTYEGQPVINESTGTKSNVWDTSDLMVYNGTLPVSISNNWELIKYVDNNHDGSYDYSSAKGISECILDFALVPVGSDVVYPSIIVTEGSAGFGAFQTGLKFSDQFIKDNIYQIDEALVNDANNNNMIDQGEVVSAGLVGDKRLESPLKYIDSNHDGKFSTNEAIIVDGNNNTLLDVGILDGSGVDRVVSSGEADLTQFKRAEKFVDGNNNTTFETGEAIIYDWYADGTFKGEFILAGDHVNKMGSLSYLSPGARNRDCVILPSGVGKAGIIQLNDRADQKYIDNNQSNSYNGFYDVWNSIDYEPILSSINDQLDKGKLDGTGTDRVLSSGYCVRSLDSNTKWSDSNHDLMYQDNEAIVYDALDDGIISSIGTGANDDKVIVSGDADLNDFNDMKYVDVNEDNDVDTDELVVNDSNQDNKVENSEIVVPGRIPFLKPFTSTDYRYCDWDHDGNYDPQQESIIYTPITPDILGIEDEIVASGSYPALTAFNPQANFIDYIQNNSYDTDEAIIIGDGDQVIEESDQIIISGKTTSFDGTNIKYAVSDTSEPYTNGRLIADSNDDILEGSEILTPGTVNLANFNPTNDFYADSNHNGRYDYKAYNSNFGEAIISDITGNKNLVETGEIKTDGYADLRAFNETTLKYSDSGARDQKYNDGELLINDINGDNKVDSSEIVFVGTADLMAFGANVKYCDSDHNNQYNDIEAVVLSDDDILQSSDTILVDGEADLHGFEPNLYRFADSDHNGIYSSGEAIIVESGWGIADNILEESDIILLEGTADLEPFPPNFMFLDDLSNSSEYEDGEAIVNDLNTNALLDPTDEIVKSGRASLKRFATSERYTDGGINAGNSLYDSDEAVIRDGNTDGKLSAGPMDGSGIDAVLMSGKAGLRHFNNNERYVDANYNGQYDGNEDIYRDEDNNGIVTGEGNDQLVFFVVENIGTATNDDISSVRLWADRDGDGQFEPSTDDAPVIKSLILDTSNPKIWYEGSAGSPPLSSASARASIGYPLTGEGQRFFVSVNTSAKPTDGRDIQMGIPLNGVKTLYGFPVPTDTAITNAYKQFIDSANPNVAGIISPYVNETVYGQIILRAETGDSVQVGKVEFYDGKPDGIRQPIAIDDNGLPWEALWDCSNAGFGNHILYARVYDKTYLRPPKTQTIKHYLDSQGINIIVGIPYAIPLASGWNYISLPVEPFNPDVSLIMSSIGSNARSIWTYEPVESKWLRYDLDAPQFLNDLTTVKAGIGYQIFMANSGTLKISGVSPETSIQLQDGWNLVGWNLQTPQNVADAISPIMANDPSIWTVNPVNGEWLGYDPDDPPNDLLTVEPGKAYWIHVVGNCVWNIVVR